MDVQIIVNPIAGRGRAPQRQAELEHALARAGHRGVPFPTARAGDARRHAARAAEFGAVAIIGGDGTVHEVLNGLDLAKAPPLLPVAMGTANVLAKELGLPRDAERLARLIDTGRPRRLDIGTVERPGGPPQRFLLMAGIGFDAFVVDVIHSVRTGPIRMRHYMERGVRALVRHRSPRMRLSVDGRLCASAATFVQVANVRAYGGPLLLSMRARPDDGLLDVMWFTGPTKLDTLRLFAMAFVRNPAALPDVHWARGRRVTVEAEEPPPLQLDGDPGGTVTGPFAIVPAAVRILVPS